MNNPNKSDKPKPVARPVLLVPEMVKPKSKVIPLTKIADKQITHVASPTRTVVNIPSIPSTINKPLPKVPNKPLPAAPKAPVQIPPSLVKTSVQIPTTLVKPQVKSLVKPEVKSLVKSEIKPQIKYIPLTKPISKPQVQPLIKPKVIKQEPEIIDIQLDENQIEWGTRVLQIIDKNYGYFDTSDAGTGKTLIAIHTALKSGLSLTVVCPASVIDHWKREAAKYGVELICVVSYESLRSTQDHQPACGLLYREDRITDGGMHKVEFFPTLKYLDIVEAGTLLVIDECFKIKNLNDTEKAVAALFEPIVAPETSTGTSSRFAFISATPCEKSKHVVTFLRVLGYIRSTNMYRNDGVTITLEGLQELIDECMHMNKKVTSEIIADLRLPSKPTKYIEELCLQLYVQVIKPTISGAMPAPEIEGVTFDIGNGFYNIAPDKAKELQKAVDAMQKDLANAVSGLGIFTRIKKTDQIIENAKLFDVARIVTDDLDQYEGNKAIICVNYLDSITELEMLLFDYNPVVLKGKIPKGKRQAIIDKFNTDPECRVIIMTTKTGGIGISLHDVDGNYPRSQYIMPSFNLIELTQATKRAMRRGVKSDVKVRIVYGKDTGKKEMECIEQLLKMKENLDKKSEVMKLLLEDGKRIKLPCEYQSFIED